MKESDLLTSVIDLAHVYHWRVAHFRPARTDKGWRTAVSADGAGFPDLVLIKEKRLIVAELKSEKGKVNQEQWDWLEAFGKANIETFIWRPRDWDEIVKVLAEKKEEV